MIYFDNAATTSPRPEVVALFVKLASQYGNPDSLHEPGRQAHKNMEESRKRIASMLKAVPEEILFTSCASESNSMAITGFALANEGRGKHIITSNSEHSSVQSAMKFLESRGFEITRLPIHEDGQVHAEDVKKAMRKDTILVSLIHVSNETGAINDISAIADVVHEHPFAVFHADCTQSFAKVDIPFEKLDMMTMSAHKIHGFKGSALLLKRKKIRLQPLLFGGQQEQGLRGGTENAPFNTALAKTIRLALDEKPQAQKRMHEIKSYLIQELSKIDGCKILSPKDGADSILCVSFDQITSQVLQNALDARGICVSAKSTCESSQSGANQVLMNMGCSYKEATHNIRLSFSLDNTMEEAKTFVAAVKEIIQEYGLPL